MASLRFFRSPIVSVLRFVNSLSRFKKLATIALSLARCFEVGCLATVRVTFCVRSLAPVFGLATSLLSFFVWAGVELCCGGGARRPDWATAAGQQKKETQHR